MSEWIDRAINRLEDECKSGKFDKYGSAMKRAVKTALLDFCRQDDEFAQAVVQGGSFTDCMAAVGKKVKNGSISDLDAYSAAVGFYFPGLRSALRCASNCASMTAHTALLMPCWSTCRHFCEARHERLRSYPHRSASGA